MSLSIVIVYGPPINRLCISIHLIRTTPAVYKMDRFPNVVFMSANMGRAHSLQPNKELPERVLQTKVKERFNNGIQDRSMTIKNFEKDKCLVWRKYVTL